MRVLVLGGSWFVGKAIVAEGVSRGWEVTTFSRGTVEPPVAATTVYGDREVVEDLRRLAGHGPWEAVVDVSGAVPAVVGRSAQVLQPVVQRCVFVSTLSTYRGWPHEPVDESSPTWEGDPDADPGTRRWDPEAYGPLKVGCELAVERVFSPDRLLVVRPHVLLGPHEYVGRLTWWLGRAARGGRVLVPGPDRSIQPMDVRDLAVFVCDQMTAGRQGVFNVAAPQGRDTFGDLVRACVAEVAAQAQAPAELTWVDENWLVRQAVTQWTEIPLWRHAAAPWALDTSRAQAAGLVCRPLAATVADTGTWLRAGGRPVPHERFAQHGLVPEREAELLAAWDRHQSGGRHSGQ